MAAKKSTPVVAVLLTVSLATLAYGYLYREDVAPHSGVKEHPRAMQAADEDGAPDLVTEMERIHAQIAGLQQASGKQSQQDVTKRLKSLSDRLESLRQQFEMLKDDVALHETSPSMPFDHAMTETEDSAAEEQQLLDYVDEQQTLLEDTAIAEGADAQWSGKAQERLIVAFEEVAEAGVGVSGVKCHSTFCRADFILDDDSPEALRSVQGISPWNSEMLVLIRDIEQGEGVVYLAREGYPLPVADQEL